jgi:hypothetical protein
MTFNIRLSILVLIMGFSIIDTYAEEDSKFEQKEVSAKVDVIIDIFPLEGELTINDYPQILKENKPENSPQFTVIAGEPNSVDISNKDLNWKSKGSTRIKFVTNTNASKFNLEFEIVRGKTNNIGSATSMEVGKIMLMSANLDNVTKLIRVTTTRQDNSSDTNEGSLAIKPLPTTEELTMVNASQNYCATISMYKIPSNKYEKPLSIISHNGEDLTSHSSGYYVHSSNKILRVKPGRHEFTATANCVDIDRAKQRTEAINGGLNNWCYASNKKRRTDEKFPGEFSFSIHVQAGKRYQLTAQRKMLSATEFEHELSASIYKVMDESCSVSDYEENIKSTRVNR